MVLPVGGGVDGDLSIVTRTQSKSCAMASYGSNLPSLPAVTTRKLSSALSDEQVRLFRDAEQWLAQNRVKYTPNNPQVLLDNPTPTHTGIRCEVINSALHDRDLMGLFSTHYDHGCSDVVARFDDEQGVNVYHVSIPYPPGGGGGGGSSRLAGFFDEPKSIMTLAGFTLLSAYFCTQPGPWKNLAALVLGVGQ